MHSKFRFKNGLCDYKRKDMIFQQHDNLESDNDLLILWLKVNNLCLSSKVDHIQKTFRNELVILLDVNVYNNNCHSEI